MKPFNCLMRLLCAGTLLAALAGDLLAQPPDLLRHYQFLPGRSTLEITGGFAGIHHESPVYGNFDFVTGLRSDCPHCGLWPYAEFHNVHAAYIDPFSGDVPRRANLDAALNLSGLNGQPGDIVIDQYFFSGEDGQGFPIRLVATEHGRQLHITGGTAPDQCCDQFNYNIHALALLAPFGDFDTDGRVDWRDYGVWKDTFGSTTDLRADGNGDGIVDTSDYAMWLSTLGQTMDDIDDGFSAVSASVPEPSSLLLIGLAAAWAATTCTVRTRAPASGQCV